MPLSRPQQPYVRLYNRAGGWIGFYIFLAQRPSISTVENQVLQFVFGDDSEQLGLLIKGVFDVAAVFAPWLVRSRR